MGLDEREDALALDGVDELRGDEVTTLPHERRVRLNREREADETGQRLGRLSALAQKVPLARVQLAGPHIELEDLARQRQLASFEPLPLDRKLAHAPRVERLDRAVFRATRPKRKKTEKETHARNRER